MDFNEALKLAREGKSNTYIVEQWWRSLAEENNLNPDSARELATAQMQTIQKIIEDEKTRSSRAKSQREMEQLMQGETDVILETMAYPSLKNLPKIDLVTTGQAQVAKAIAERGGGGAIYRNVKGIKDLPEEVRPKNISDEEIKDLTDSGQGWSVLDLNWYTKEEYIDIIKQQGGDEALQKQAGEVWDNNDVVNYGADITDMGPKSKVGGTDTDTKTDTDTPSAAAAAAGAAGGKETKEAAQLDTPTPSSVGGIIDTGLDYTKLAELGITPSQQARALPTMLQGGTSPFVARGYSNILQNYADIFPMLMIAGQVPGFGLDEGVEAGMLDESDMSTLANPKAFATFINQKPEKIANDIKTTLALLESAKTANAADPEWALNNSTTQQGLLLEFFTNNPDQYNRIGGKELALRQTLGKMGKPRWLGDLISNQLEKKYNQQLLIDPNKIAEAGFYKNAFANFTTGNTLLDTEVKTEGIKTATSGASLTSKDKSEVASITKAGQGIVPATSGSIDMDAANAAMTTNTSNNTFKPSPDANMSTSDKFLEAEFKAIKEQDKFDARNNATPAKTFDPTSNINTGSDIEQDIPAGVTGTTLDNDKSSPTFGMMVTYEDGVKTSAYKIDMQTGQKFMYDPMTGLLSSQQSGRIDPNTGATMSILGNPNRINTDIPVLGAGVNNMFQPSDPNINPVATGPAPTAARAAELIKLAGIPPNPNAALSSTEPSSPLNPSGGNLDLNKPKTIASREDEELDKFLEQGEWLY